MNIEIEDIGNGQAIYVSQEGDMVDHIGFKYYGTHAGTAEAIYAANRELAEYGPVLPIGVSILLPKMPVPTNDHQIELWT